MYQCGKKTIGLCSTKMKSLDNSQDISTMITLPLVVGPLKRLLMPLPLGTAGPLIKVDTAFVTLDDASD